MNLPYHTTANHHATVPDDVAHQEGQSMESNKLALISRHKFSGAIPNQTPMGEHHY